MDKLLKNAAAAWNPVASIRERRLEGTLELKSVFPTFVGIAIACALAYGTAEGFFTDSLEVGLGRSLDELDNPLMSPFAQQIGAFVTIMVPVGALWLLPEGLYQPARKSEALSAIVIICASWFFYGAVFKTVTSIFLGFMAQDNPQGAIQMYFVLNGIVAVIIIVLFVVFWTRALRGELGLSAGSLLAVSAVFLLVLFGTAFAVLQSLPSNLTGI